MPKVPLLLAIDIGTESSRACLLKDNGEVVATASTEHSLSCPNPGWAEQDPMDWWKATVRNIRAVIEQSRCDPDQIAAVGAAAQMHAAVPISGSGELLSSAALLWCDKRSADICDQLNTEYDEMELVRQTGNALVPSWTGPKIRWLKDNLPDQYRNTWKYLSCSGFINYMLTGAVATDYSEASGTYLFDAHKKTWSPELCELLGVDIAKLPDIFPAQHVVGKVSKAAAASTGLKEGTLVVNGGGDMMCILLGAGLVTEGRACDITGTAADISVYVPEPLYDKRLMHLHSVGTDGWIAFGILDAGGGSLRWFKDVFAPEQVREARARGVSPYAVLSELAADVEPGSEKLMFFPYLLGERTLGSSHSSGVFFGFRYTHGIGHCARAIMEGVTFDLKQSLDLIKAKGIRVDEIRAIAGGAQSEVWRSIKANVYGHPVVTLENFEGGLLGAAILAGIGAGIYHDAVSAVDKIVKVGARMEPDLETHQKYQQYYELFKDLHDQLQPFFVRMTELD